LDDVEIPEVIPFTGSAYTNDPRQVEIILPLLRETNVPLLGTLSSVAGVQFENWLRS